MSGQNIYGVGRGGPSSQRVIDHAELVRAHREQVIAAAIADHKILPSRADFWRERYDEDPTNAQRLLSELTPVPEAAEVAASEAQDSEAGTGLLPELRRD